MLAHSSPARSQPPPPEMSDGGSSSLSELGEMPDDQQELVTGFGREDSSPRDNDTEASTEKLDSSPLKQRDLPTHDAIRLDELASVAAVEQLQEANAEADNEMQEVVEQTADAPQATIEVLDRPLADIRGTTHLASPGKRKRSSSLSELEDDLIDQGPPARKRSASTRAVDPEGTVHGRISDGLGNMIEEEESIRVEVEPPEEFEGDENYDAPGEDLEEQPREPATAKDEEEVVEEGAPSDQTPSPDENERPLEAEPENENIAKAAADEDEAEAAAKNEDELAKKRAAMDDLKPIETLFAVLRDKLFDDRLDQISAEIESLRQPNTAHPEFLAKKQAIDFRRDQKIQLEDTAFRYKFGALERKAIAERAIAHSQFAQEVREIREAHLDEMNAYFNRLQRERRQWKGREEYYLYQYNPKRPQQIANQRAYNKEVSLLSGIARYRGFPAAPVLEGARPHEAEDDLKKIKAQSRSQPISYAAQIANDEMAGEANFLEKNPWARPVPMATMNSTGNPTIGGQMADPTITTPLPLPLQWNGVGRDVQHESLPNASGNPNPPIQVEPSAAAKTIEVKENGNEKGPTNGENTEEPPQPTAPDPVAKSPAPNLEASNGNVSMPDAELPGMSTQNGNFGDSQGEIMRPAPLSSSVQV